MAKYVDAFVLVIPKKKVAEYKKMAKEGSATWRKFGAIDYKECVGVNLKPDTGGAPMLGFAKMVNLKPSETVWFSWVVYKSKAHRDQVNKKVMDFFSKKYEGKEEVSMPFDLKRSAIGGFSVEVE